VQFKPIGRIFFTDQETRSKNSSGSLANIKKSMNHKNASENVSQNFQHVYDLVEDAMNGLAVLKMLKKMNIKHIDEVPEDFPVTGSEQECRQYIKDVVEQTVIDLESECRPMNSPESSCFCGASDSSLVCCDNYLCQRSFHEECIPQEISTGIQQHSMTGNYCSLKCADRVNAYSNSLLYASLMQTLYRKAIRKNDVDLI